jgi:hypothetical protein
LLEEGGPLLLHLLKQTKDQQLGRLLAATDMQVVYQAQGGYKVLVAFEAEIRRLHASVKGEVKDE